MIDVEELKKQHPIVDVARRYTAIRQQGKRWIGFCPFHEDRRTPNLDLNPETNLWHCFACGQGGDVITFIERIHRVDFKDALGILGGLPAAVAPVLNIPTPKPERTLEEVDYRILKVAAELYNIHLFGTKPVYEYTRKRGISNRSLRLFRVGYCRGDYLISQLSFKRLPVERAVKLGLLRSRREYFCRRLVIINTDRMGRVCHMVGRSLEEKPAVKYLALPGLPKPLYGLERVCRSKTVFMVEGPFDWLTLKEWGYQGVCTLGTQIKEQYAARLASVCRLVILPHNDDPGREAAERWAAQIGPVAHTLFLPDGVKDLNELAQQPDGRETFDRLVAGLAA